MSGFFCKYFTENAFNLFRNQSKFVNLSFPEIPDKIGRSNDDLTKCDTNVQERDRSTRSQMPYENFANVTGKDLSWGLY